jgi:CBS domain-containing protein
VPLQAGVNTNGRSPAGCPGEDVINQLEADDVSALVVSDDGTSIFGIISAGDIVRGLKAFGRDVVDRPLGDLMSRDVIFCDIGEPTSRSSR